MCATANIVQYVRAFTSQLCQGCICESEPVPLTCQLNLGDTPHTLGAWGDEFIDEAKPESGKRSTNANFTKLGETTEGFVFVSTLFRFTRIRTQVSPSRNAMYGFVCVIAGIPAPTSRYWCAKRSWSPCAFASDRSTFAVTNTASGTRAIKATCSPRR